MNADVVTVGKVAELWAVLQGGPMRTRDAMRAIGWPVYRPERLLAVATYMIPIWEDEGYLGLTDIPNFDSVYSGLI